jgi:hypothetical protein
VDGNEGSCLHRSAVSAFLPTATARELKNGGWNGSFGKLPRCVDGAARVSHSSLDFAILPKRLKHTMACRSGVPQSLERVLSC